MSLPTYATFIKNNKIVGIASCNVGWWVTAPGLVRCIKESMDNAWERYREDTKIVPGTNDYDRDEKYFTTKEDLARFDYINLYEINIPHTLAMDIYDDLYDSDHLEEWLNHTNDKFDFDKLIENASSILYTIFLGYNENNYNECILLIEQFKEDCKNKSREKIHLEWDEVIEKMQLQKSLEHENDNDDHSEIVSSAKLKLKSLILEY